MPRQYTPRVPCTCLTCGEAFDKPPSVIRQGGGKYCSKACTPHPQRPRGGEARSCARCGKPFYLFPYEVATGREYFCSISCSKRKYSAPPATFTCKQCGAVKPWP